MLKIGNLSIYFAVCLFYYISLFFLYVCLITVSSMLKNRIFVENLLFVCAHKYKSVLKMGNLSKNI